MTAEELKDIALCGETTKVQFKQEFTSQKEIAKDMIAFANGRGGKTLTGEIWVKQGADKRRITENVEILGLFQDSGTYKPELQALKGSSVSNLEMTSINEYFKRNFGKEKEAFGMPLENLLQSQKILTDNNELTVAGAMFFARDPQFFMPAFVIKAVAFYGNDIAGSEYRDSRDITGTIPWMFREAMSFVKSNLHHRQNGQNFNKTGILEIPEVVLEELIQNCLVHLDLLEPAAIRLLIFENRVEIINSGCLYGGLEVKDILLGVTKQRNPTMASLSSRTMIYRGLGSGILRATRENVKVEFVNNESANEFKTIVWRPISGDGVIDDVNTEKTDLSGNLSTILPDKTNLSGKIIDKIRLSGSLSGKLPMTEAYISKLTEIYFYISTHPHSTKEDVASYVGRSDETSKKYLQVLTAIGMIAPEGGNKNRTYSSAQ